MRNIVIALAISMVGGTTLKAQVPNFWSTNGFTFTTGEAGATEAAVLELGRVAEVEPDDQPCNPSAYTYSTNLSGHQFNQPVKAPAFESQYFTSDLRLRIHKNLWCPGLSNILFQVDNVTKMAIQGSDGSVRVHHTATVPWTYAFQINVDNDETKAFTVINKNLPEANREVFKIWGNGVVNAKKIYAEEIAVTANAGNIHWYDYVFNKDYKLMSLYELEQFIQTNKHLPEIPSETEVKENGINLGEMQGKLLLKIEELTLYIIELQKQIDELKQTKEEKK